MGFVHLLEVLHNDGRPASPRKTSKPPSMLPRDKKRKRGFRRRSNVAQPGGESASIGRRVRTLKALIPNGESMGLEGLFTETTDYIALLETRVRTMRMVVEAMTACNNDL
ncbi:hypothetical protein MLD38_010314 [Melastoma candidum]|uniref:Uncharacterized protein n=1 Tax=Melastoma candidum TaxID=119954 RepID=A0ACB9QZ12_9MYRT|nr:hypothetical protein MLD38_010314 [Melastoma candidum]